MGNQIAGLSPPPLVNVEDYLSDLVNKVRFEEELLGSRLFKVAKARRTDDYNSQLIVVKVFPNPNTTDLLSIYTPLIRAYSYPIVSGHNLLAFTVQADRNLLLIRDYVDQSLVDRLCTRPFLCMEEKRWIAFQLLQAVAQMHSSFGQFNGEPKVLCHGDIKAENVLITSWGWVLLSDPAPFKPCWLPVDNPSEFTHYFDSARRRVCYLAPERFRDSTLSPSAYGNNAANSSCTEDESSLVLVPGSAGASQSNETVHSSTVPPRTSSSTSCDVVTIEEEFNSSTVHTNSGPTKVTRPSNVASKKHTRSFNNGRHLEFLLDPSMDLFSVGCVLLELFTDGSVAFTLADLLSYRSLSDAGRLDNLLDKISCLHVKSLISSLLSLDRSSRGTAEGHLSAQRGKAFPEVFYSHLLDYMQTFLSTHLQNPTVRITYMRCTLSALLREVSVNSPSHLSLSAVILSNLVTSVLRPLGTAVITQTPHTTAVSTTAQPKKDLTVHVYEPVQRSKDRFAITKNAYTTGYHLQEVGKINALICLLELCAHLESQFLLDRIVPYCVDLTSAIHSTEVRCFALESLCQLVDHATLKYAKSTVGVSTSFIDVSFLTEYLFPTLAPLSVDQKVEVRSTYARCIPSLTESALRFLDASCSQAQHGFSVQSGVLSQSHTRTQKFHMMESMQSALKNYDLQLSILQTHIQDRFSDLDRQVLHSLITTENVVKLSTFFGRSHTSGTLLSHVITFLNDKDNASLRTSFYRQIPHLVSLVGAQSICIVRSLLEQGLIDPNETVLEMCLRALTHLLNQRLLTAPIAVNFFTRCLALTAHPLKRIRQTAVSYITAFARLSISAYNSKPIIKGPRSTHAIPTPEDHFGMCSPASVYARLSDSENVKVFLRRPVRHSVTNEALLLSNLRPPISRSVLDNLLITLKNQSLTSRNPELNLTHFMQLLRERDSSRMIAPSGSRPCYTQPQDETVAFLLAKLQSLGLTELMESQLVHLSVLIHYLYESIPSNQAEHTTWDTSLPVRSRVVDLQRTSMRRLNSTSHKSFDFTESWVYCTDLPTYTHQLAIFLQPPACAYERSLCKALLSGRLPLFLPTKSSRNLKTLSFGRGVIWSTASHTSNQRSNSEQNMGQLKSSQIAASGQDASSDYRHALTRHGDSQQRPTIGCPQGILVAHLHEHRAGAMSLAVHTSGRLLASCSSGDDTVRLWNCGLWPVDADGYLNQSAFTVNRIGTESTNQAQRTKPNGLAELFALPTRSWWTYHAGVSGSADHGSCRGLVWNMNGSSLVTLAESQWLHRIDVATGRQCSSARLDLPAHGRAICLTASAYSQFPAYLRLTHSRTVGSSGSDLNVVSFATTSNHIIGRDLRIPLSSQPIWCLKQERSAGLIRSFALHSCHTWLVTGTSRGQVVCWDLRYERPIARVQQTCQTQTAIVNLQISELPSSKVAESSAWFASKDVSRTYVVATTDRHNGISIWDLEACASASSIACSSRNSPVYATQVPVPDGGLLTTACTKSDSYSPVRSILTLPPSPNHGPLPNLIAGGKDGRLRYWDFNEPVNSKVFTRSEGEPVYLYRENVKNNIRNIIELPCVNNQGAAVQNPTGGLLHQKQNFKYQPKNITQSRHLDHVQTSSSDSFPPKGGLDLIESGITHRNLISDINLINVNQYLLVSASMDGVIKIWQ